MEAETQQTFRSLTENVGPFKLKDKTFLIPQMNRIGGHLLAGAFRSFGVNAVLMDTYEGLDLGKAFTSGKECFPCQVTTGDILLFLKKEKERLGKDIDPDRYIYFMPEAEGPCRFGMYNKYQRVVLDSFARAGEPQNRVPDLQELLCPGRNARPGANGRVPESRVFLRGGVGRARQAALEGEAL